MAEAPASVRREQAASLANQLRQALAQGDGRRHQPGLTRLLFEEQPGRAKATQFEIVPPIESPWTALNPHDYRSPFAPQSVQTALRSSFNREEAFLHP